MKFIDNIELTEYEEFVEKNEYKSHFLQSSMWGEFSSIDKGLIPHYVGLKENEKLVCATLLLEKKLVFGYSYFYAPRGYVINFEDFNLLKTFTNELKKYVKKHRGIFIKIDPDVIIKKYNYKDEEIEVKTNAYENLKKLGYKHLGFTKRFETTQPRFSFRIDFNQPFEQIEEHFSKTTKQRIKKANDLDVSVTLSDDIEAFYNLMNITENRKGFVTHNKKYYQDLYNIFSKKNKCNIFLGSVDINKIISKNKDIILEIENEMKEIKNLDNLSKSMKTKLNELEKRKEKLLNDNIKYQEEKEQYGNNIILSAHFIVEYGNKAWVLYAGNHDILSYTYANYKTYFEHIKYYYDKGIKIYDQFGTVGKLEENDPLLGLHEFKKKFGGDYVEFVGEFDLITNKLMYFLFKKLVPFYRNRKFKQNIKKNS